MKTLTPDEYLSRVEPYLSEDLVSPRNLEDMHSLANYFSRGLTSFWGFECRLGNASPFSDWMFAVSNRKGERQELADHLESWSLPESFRQRPEWKHIRDFTRAWTDPGSVLYDNVLGAWFEFDMPDSPPSVQIPSVFIQPRPIHAKAANDTGGIQWITRYVLPMLAGQNMPQETERRFYDCIRHLPDGAVIFQVATMLSRSTSGIKINVKGINPVEVVSYLNAVGWSDQTGCFSSLVEELAGHVGHFFLNFNVSDVIGPEIGLECFLRPERPYDREQEIQWCNFLDYLVSKGLCLPEKRDALLQFPGIDQEDPGCDLDIESLVPAVKIKENDYSSAVVRNFSHVKVVFKHDQPLEAKAYLSVREFGHVSDSVRQDTRCAA